MTYEDKTPLYLKKSELLKDAPIRFDTVICTRTDDTDACVSQLYTNEIIEIETPKVQPNPTITSELELRNQWQSVDIFYTTIEFDYLGVFFITAYCPYECGYNGENFPRGWTTSSGAICHYHDEWYEPTTCAIDRSILGYNEYLLVGDPYDPSNRKVYVTEDTGPGVRGKWIDCFVLTMDEVDYWPTRYETVYSVSYEDNILRKNERKEIHEWINNYLHDRSSCSWFDSRNGN